MCNLPKKGVCGVTQKKLHLFNILSVATSRCYLQFGKLIAIGITVGVNVLFEISALIIVTKML